MVLQVMLDSSRFTHSAGRNDDFRIRIEVELPGLVAGPRKYQIFKVEGIVSP
jgi:hypothetical protein